MNNLSLEELRAKHGAYCGECSCFTCINELTVRSLEYIYPESFVLQLIAERDTARAEGLREAAEAVANLIKPKKIEKEESRGKDTNYFYKVKDDIILLERAESAIRALIPEEKK